MTPDLESDLRELLGPGSWSIAPARGRSRGSSWVVRGGGRSLFVKAGGNEDLLRALGELEVAPRVVASGRRPDLGLVVQEFVEGVAPDGPWIDAHVEAVGRLINQYHSDRPLGVLVAPLLPHDFVESLAQRFVVRSSEMAPKLRRLLDESLRLITASAVGLAPAEPVLTHGDPNTSNLILGTSDVLYLIDWDEARLSDPVRDIGQILWWYVRPVRWRLGLAACRLADDSSVHQRIYWWAAAESVDVALGLVEEGNEAAATAFARDARAASKAEVNLRAWWLDGSSSGNPEIDRRCQFHRTTIRP